MGKNLNNICLVPSDLVLPKRVYKYRVINQRLFDLLQHNEIWFANLESFNDPFEPARIFSPTPYGNILKNDIANSGILSLCKSSLNLPMWSYYGDGLKGVAIGYNTEELLRTLEPVHPDQNELSPRWRYVFDMKYDDNKLGSIIESNLLLNNAMTDKERQKMFATKSNSYSHENEFRIVIQPESFFINNDVKSQWTESSGLYRYSQDSIEEIIFGELCTSQNRKHIKQILANKELNYKEVIRSKNDFTIELRDERE
jgi:hypothetical protein